MASLKQQQEKFQQQQARLLHLQSSLGSHVAPPAKPRHTGTSSNPSDVPSTASRAHKGRTPASPPPSGSASKHSFIADAEKLMQIENIRNAPVLLQVKRVVEVLLERKPGKLTMEQINEMSYIDLTKRQDVLQAVKKNVKVDFDGTYFSYKAKHDLENKDELLHLVRRVPEGMSMVELKDAYQGIENDVQELKAAGQVWTIQNSDNLEEIVYPNDPRANIKLEVEIRDLLMSVEIPRDFVDVEKELQKMGMKPATNSAKRRELAGMVQRSPEKKKKPKRASRQTKYTNVHLMNLFENPLGGSTDEHK